MNVIHLRGNITRDIELRYAATGTAIGKTAIASTRKFTSNGENKEEVMFMDIVFFGRSAEIANQYLNKGSNILLTGRVVFSSWKDHKGDSRTKHEVVVESMEFIDTRTKAPKDLDPSVNQGMPQKAGVQRAKQPESIPQSEQSEAVGLF